MLTIKKIWKIEFELIEFTHEFTRQEVYAKIVEDWLPHLNHYHALHNINVNEINPLTLSSDKTQIVK